MHTMCATSHSTNLCFTTLFTCEYSWGLSIKLILFLFKKKKADILGHRLKWRLPLDVFPIYNIETMKSASQTVPEIEAVEDVAVTDLQNHTEGMLKKCHKW